MQMTFQTTNCFNLKPPVTNKTLSLCFIHFLLIEKQNNLCNSPIRNIHFLFINSS